MENGEQLQKGPEAGTNLFGETPVKPGDTVITSEVKEPTAGPVTAETVVTKDPEPTQPTAMRPTVADGGLRNGYQFKDPNMTTEYLGETITAETLTDKVARRLFQNQPRWAAENLTRGCYAPNDPYWA